MDQIELVNLLVGRVQATLGPRGIANAGATSTDRRARHGSRWTEGRFIDLYAVKPDLDGQVEFSRTIAIVEVRRLGPNVVADQFCKDAENALAKLSVK
jgi:hypothetical protein